MTALQYAAARRHLHAQMLLHVWVGHPVASVLSLLGLRRAAEWIHYWTLSARTRRRVRRADVRYDHAGLASLFHDVAVAPIVATLDATGRHDTADRWSRRLSSERARAGGWCGAARPGTTREPPAQRRRTDRGRQWKEWEDRSHREAEALLAEFDLYPDTSEHEPDETSGILVEAEPMIDPHILLLYPPRVFEW